MSEDISDSVLAMADLSVEETDNSTAEESTDETKEKVEDKTEAQTDESTAEADDIKGIDPQHSAMLAKAEDANKKFQSEKGRADELQQQLDDLNRKPMPDPIDDPEGFNQRQEERFKQERALNAKERHRDRISMSRNLISTVHEDYDKYESIFYEEAKENSVLVDQFNTAENPALFAYEQGKKFEMLKADPVELREQIRQEERAKILAEVDADKEAKAKQSAEVDNAISPSLAKQGNAGLDTSESIGLDFIAEATGEDASRRRK